MNINDSTSSEDEALKATLTAFDPRRGEGQLKIEELKAERGRFYVTVTYGEAGQTRIDYKTYDLKRPPSIPSTPTGMTPSKRSKSSGLPPTDPAPMCPGKFFFSCQFELPEPHRKVRHWAMGF